MRLIAGYLSSHNVEWDSHFMPSDAQSLSDDNDALEALEVCCVALCWYWLATLPVAVAFFEGPFLAPPLCFIKSHLFLNSKNVEFPHCFSLLV